LIEQITFIFLSESKEIITSVISLQCLANFFFRLTTIKMTVLSQLISVLIFKLI
jgi:hypothetical protein